MAIPEYPITRREQYLDAIATNDTSVLPAEPITRTEQYLDAIARNGGSGGSTGGGVLVVGVDWNTADGTLDKTWQEIHDSDFAVLRSEDEFAVTWMRLDNVREMNGQYGVVFITYEGTAMTLYVFVASSADGYPVYTEL